MAKPDARERQLVYPLLQESATIGEISAYLKRRDVPHSAGSWEDLLNKRISKL